jgi:secreted Zn-dependent insulinase-like peptidase
MAESASITCKLNFYTFYVDIDLKGFNDSLDKFLPKYLGLILNYVPEETTEFEDIRQKKKKEYENFFLENPYQQAYQYHILALRDGAEVDPAAVFQTVDHVKFEHILRYNRRWKESLFAELYVAGNFTEKKATDFTDILSDLLKQSKPLEKSRVRTIRAVSLKENQIWAVEKLLVNNDEKNSSLIVHFQYEEFGLTTKLLQDLCVMFMKEPTFDYLRTKEQLGYIVMCLPDDHRGILGLSILVQSNIKGSHELSFYIENLRNILKEKLENLTVEDFENLKKSAYTAKLQKDKDLDTETTRFWAEITKHTYVFDRK